MKSAKRIACWCLLGIAAGYACTRETPRAAPYFYSQSMMPFGITAALQHQNEGAMLVDLRPFSPHNLPVHNSSRNWKRFSHTQKIIVIGDETAAREIKNSSRIVGIVASWTLKRDAHIPASWEVSTAQLSNKTRNYQILDLREVDEWKTSHIPDSRQISMFEIESVLKPKSRKVALFCLTGHRSAFVVRRLRERGFANVVSVRGGWLDWQAQKRKLVSGGAI